MKNEVTIKDAKVGDVKLAMPQSASVTLTRAQLEAALKEINEPDLITMSTKDFKPTTVKLSNGQELRLERRWGLEEESLYLDHVPEGYEWALRPTTPGERYTSRELFIRKVGDSK